MSPFGIYSSVFQTTKDLRSYHHEFFWPVCFRPWHSTALYNDLLDADAAELHRACPR